MRKTILLCILTAMAFSAISQDFSNKGKDFWVGYGYHERMTGGGNSQDMVLYFATDQVTNIVISIPALGYIQNITTGAGNIVTTSAPIPKTGVNDARLNVEGLTSRGIHVTSDKPMVAYAHVYNASVSGATILYPTNTLGKEYYSINYKNWSNQTNANPFFYVIATDTGTTKVEITPTANTVGGWVGGTTYTISLTQGQIYNVMGVLVNSPANCNPVCTAVDLTGSKVLSINSGTGCKKIAVFSGSGRISITCNSNNSSSDNYMVQAMPKTAWGKKYLTVTSGGNQTNNFFRICTPDPTTVVKLDGVIIPIPGFYYEFGSTNIPHKIEADQPIMVAQYFTSQGACGNGGQPGDPEVIYLSAVEQNINTVLWNATPNFAITQHYINVVIPNTGTAVSSFTLDGATLPFGTFIVHPQDANYVYMKKAVTVGAHFIHSDSGFNAIAYGFGNAESYGYNAGTNIKDLYQQIGVQTQYGIETTPSVCTNAPFRFKVSLPYQPDSMYWNFHNAPGMLPNNTNVLLNSPSPVIYDSTTIVNGKTIYWYSLPTYYNLTAIGTYPITITTYLPPTASTCGNVQDIDFDLVVSNPPVADFAWTGGGCFAEPFQFNETTPQLPKPTYHFWWDFGDPASGVNNNSAARNPLHTFSAPGTYNVRFSDITTPGCLSDTILHQVIVAVLPNATIDSNRTACINSVPAPYITFRGIGGTPPYTFYYHINAGGALNVASTGTNTTAVVFAPTLTAGTFVYTLDSVKNTGSTVCVQSVSGQKDTIIIVPDATIVLTSGPGSNNQTVCVNTAIIPITYLISGSGTGGTITAGGLPPGVTGVFAGGIFTISGSPTASGVYNYTITTNGPCGNTSISGTINVSGNSSIALSSGAGTDNQTVCINTPLVSITYAIGGTATGASVTAGALPAGVTGSFAGGVFTITGTPSVSGVFNYTVTTAGPCVNTSASGTITVNANSTITLSSAAGTDNQTVCINTPIINITYAIAGGGNGASVTAGGLPAGVTGSYAGGVFTIIGTPTISGVFPYTITTNGPCINPSISGTITVNANSTIALSSAAGTDNQTVCINTPIADITYMVAAGGTGAIISAGGLPAGVTGSFAGGIFTITGTPTVSGVFPYTLSTTGPCVNPSVSGTITVNANSTITLTSAAGTDNQTTCIGNPIVNITYAIGGGGSGATVTGLPAGVNGVFSGGVFTISGAPTVSGIFNYTVTTLGPCVNNSMNGTIHVDANSTIALTSAAGTDNQTICINTPILDIMYTIGAGGTGGSITAGGLPAGVTGSFAAGVFTITGTPTVSGIFNYTVSTTGPCINTSLSGTIHVNANSTIALSSAAGTDNQTKCINTPIVNITYTIGSGGTGATITAGGLPAGVTGSYAGGVFTITGTPTVSGVFPYTVTTNGPCVNVSASGTITVSANSTLTLTSAAGTANQAVCRLSTIGTITYAVAGGGTGISITAGGLPAGVTGVYAGGIFTISGAPTVSGIFNYTVSTSGPCINPSLSGTITVFLLPTPNFTYNAPSCETRTIFFTDASIPNQGVLSTWSWNFGDPGSGAANTSAVQNPTHVFAGAGTYTVTLSVNNSMGCTSIPIKSIPVTINERPLAGFIIPEVCLSDTYAQFLDTSKVTLPSTLVAWAWNFGDPGSGVNNTSTLQNPTHSYSFVGPYNVRLIVTTNTGCKDTIVQVLTVNGSFPISSFTVNSPAVLCANDSVGIINQSTVFPGVITQAEITWDLVNFPGAVQVDPNPFFGKVYKHLYPNFQVPATKNFTIRFRAYSGGVCLKDTMQTITVHAAPKVQFNNIPDTCLLAAPFQLNEASEVGGVPGTGVYSGLGVSPTGIFSPAIAGVGSHSILYVYTSTAAGCVDSLRKNILVLDTAHANFSYVTPACDGFPISFTDQSTAPAGVTPSNTVWNFGDGSPIQNHPAGSTFTHVFPGPNTYFVTMYDVSAYGCNSTVYTKAVVIDPNHTITLTSGAGSDNQVTCINVAINPITYALGGGATGATVTGLPAGITYNVAGTTLTISGASTTVVGSPFNYSIVTTGNSCTIATASGTIIVNDNTTIALSSAAGTDNQTICINTILAPITYTIGGGGTGAVISAGALPAGITGTYAAGVFTISGTPTVSGVFNYTVTTTGPCVNPSLNGTITVNANSTISLSSAAGTDNQTICINTPVTNITYAIGGGGTGASITAGALPAGMNGSYAAGVFTITGSPTVSGVFNYTVTTQGPCINPSISGTINVSADHTITLTSGAGTDVQRVCLNTAIASITYDIGGGASGFTVTGLPPGVTATQTGNTITISGSPSSTVGTPYNFTIITTGNPCITASATGTIKVSPIPVPLFGFDKTFYCIPNALVGFINNSSIEDGTENAFTYLWNFGDPSSGINNSSVAKNPSHFYNTVGSYTIRLTVTSSYGCPKDTSFILNTIHPQLKASFTTDKPSACLGQDLVTFTDNTNYTDGSPDKYFWDFGDGTTDISNPTTHMYISADTFKVSFYIINSIGCNSDTVKNQPFPVYNFPVVSAGPDRYILEGGSLIIQPVVSGQNLQFLWTPNTYMNDATLQNPMVSNLLTDMTYRLKVVGIGGCTKSSSMFIKLLKFPQIPNTFTPNGDGRNDKWFIAYLDTYPNNFVQVFTRTGQLVFESHGYKVAWDGTYKGKPLPLDTYYYIIEPGNGRDPITGYVTIIK